MNHMTRVKSLEQARRTDLDALIATQFAIGKAANPVLPGTFIRRLNTAVKQLAFPSLVDLMVWYELECKGPQNARQWRDRLRPGFASRRTGNAAAVLSYIDRLLELTREGTRSRTALVAIEANVCERTVVRRMEEFAKTAGFTYSLNWLVFLRALYRELEERPELLEG